jgi:hypothetical protein
MFKELPPALQDELKRRHHAYGDSKDTEYALHVSLLRLYEKESKRADEVQLASESARLLDMIAKLGDYYSPNHVLEAAVREHHSLAHPVMAHPGGEKLGMVFNYLDRVYDLRYRGISYFILTVGFATLVVAISSRVKLSALEFTTAEFITVFVAGLILMLVGVGIRVFEAVVKVRAAADAADDEESDSA